MNDTSALVRHFLARLLRPARFAAAALLLIAAPVALADEGDHALGSSTNVPKRALQELIGRGGHAQHSQGSVYVTIHQASLYGENTVYRPFCSPTIYVINSAQETVGEFIFAIHYKGVDRKPAGSTITRLSLLKTGKQETDYFHSSVKVNSCRGIVGDLEIIQCVYLDGTDCSDDVRALPGAIQLQLAAKIKEKK